MRILVKLAAFFLLTSALSACRQAPTPAIGHASYVLLNAVLLDNRGVIGEGETALVVDQGRISYVGARDGISLPDSVPRYDMDGMYVMPGLMDLHIHPPSRRTERQTLQTLLAFGITTARVAASTDESGLELRDRVASGETLGPTIYTAGRLIDAPYSVHRTAAEVRSIPEIQAEVRRQIEDGVDLIKLYVGLEDTLVAAAIAEAHLHGIKVLGHLGTTSWLEAASSDIDGLTHSGLAGPLWELIPHELQPVESDYGLPGRLMTGQLLRQWRDGFSLESRETNLLATTLLQHDVEVNPNLVLTWAMLYGSTASAIERFEPQFADKRSRNQWVDRPHPFSRSISAESVEEVDSLYTAFASIFAKLHETGVLVTVGTDLGLPWMTPGVAFHEELSLLHEAGLSSTDVVKAATLSGATALGVQRIGQLRQGWEADLVVLRGNPLEDIRKMRDIDLVISDGVGYKPTDILFQ